MKHHAPAAARNSAPIAEVLECELPARGLVLELASGTGQHAADFARRFPDLDWQPSDVDPGALASIGARAEDAALSNLRPPIVLDAAERLWPVAAADAILCINMVHISPWRSTQGLFAGAGRVLAPGAPLILYGPYLEHDVETAPSNLAFDRDLRARDPRWGLRDTHALDRLGAEHDFRRTARRAMSANNLILVYRRV